MKTVCGISETIHIIRVKVLQIYWIGTNKHLKRLCLVVRDFHVSSKIYLKAVDWVNKTNIHPSTVLTLGLIS